MLPGGFVDPSGNVSVCFYSSYYTGSGAPYGILRLQRADANGNQLDYGTVVTDETTATTAFDYTRPSVTVDQDTAYVTWTDNRWGSSEVVLRILSP